MLSFLNTLLVTTFSSLTVIKFLEVGFPKFNPNPSSVTIYPFTLEERCVKAGTVFTVFVCWGLFSTWHTVSLIKNLLNYYTGK